MALTDDTNRRQLSDSQLASAVRGVQKHAGHGRRAGREWRPLDTATMREYGRRTWNWACVEGLKLIGVPRAVENLLFHETPTGRRMHRAVWRPLVGACCAAYRSGRLGVRLSFEQIAVMLGTSRRTAARVVSELVAARILRRDHTYLCDDGGTERVFDVSVYAVGGRLLEYARGGLEPGEKGGRWGAAARQRAKNERRERYKGLWDAQRETRGPSFAQRWLSGAALVIDSLRGSDKVAPTPRKLGAMNKGLPPLVKQEKIEGRLQLASPAPLSATESGETHEQASTPVAGHGRSDGLTFAERYRYQAGLHGWALDGGT
jgi:hypothetical protein